MVTAMLVEVTHRAPLRSAAEAETLMLALRIGFVSVNYLRPLTPEAVDEVLRSFEPKKESSVSFEKGSLKDAEPSLRALACAVGGPEPFKYLDVRTRRASLRIWPALDSSSGLDRSPPQKDESPVASAPFRVENSKAGTTLCPGSAAEAVEEFLSLNARRISGCFINGITSEGRELSRAFLCAAGAPLSVRAELRMNVARSLTERCGADAEWQANGLRICFPSGKMSGFFTGTNTTPEAIAQWHERIDQARIEAGIDG